MHKTPILLILLLISFCAAAQEVLLPLSHQRVPIIDQTKETPFQEKNAVHPLSLPFFDDFSDHSGLLNPNRWSGHQALVNDGYGALPPTVGMVTLDALDSRGELYSRASTGLFQGDTLTSQPIRLDSLFSPQRRALTPADSIYLSFFFLPSGGNGDMWERLGDSPEAEDSLMLEFYNPTDSLWHLIWSTGGMTLDSLLSQTGTSWQYVLIPITDSVYLSGQFRFRFRNYCSLDATAQSGMVGNTDMWSLDYIYLNYGRSCTDNTFRDIAFVNPATSLLSRYQAMPWRQYQASEMCHDLPLTITNLYSQPLATSYQYTIFDNSGAPVHQYDGGYENTPAFLPDHTYQTVSAHASPTLSYSFPTLSDTCSFLIEHVLREGVSGDAFSSNDTIRFRQQFADYFAYDDGTAENGYGLTSTGSRMELAYGFHLNQSDTLTALDLSFNSTRGHENLAILFYLCVWTDEGGKPGALLYRDSQRRHVLFDSLNTFVRYPLESPLALNGDIFVGFEQVGNAYINLGFDRNHDARSHTYYRTSGSWQQSILRGALLLRPRFDTPSVLAINDDAKAPQLAIYPNPAHQHVTISCSSPQTIRLQLFSLQGACLLDLPCPEALDLSGYPTGLYLLRATDSSTGLQTTQKLLLR